MVKFRCSVRFINRSITQITIKKIHYDLKQFHSQVNSLLPSEHVVDDVEREHAHADRDVGGRKGHDEEVRRDLRVSLSKLERGPKYWLLLLLVKKKQK